jgi:foldase protein PrsA
MQVKGRCISALISVGIASTGLAACGGGSEKTVAQIEGVGSISEAMLEHWMPIEARIIYSEAPTRPAPSGVVPDPPTYTACIAYLRTTPQKAGERPGKQKKAQLRARCARKEQELKVLTLNTLIGWDWMIGRGLRLGVGVTDAEARQRLEAIKSSEFAGTSFSKYLKYSGQTVSDMLLRARVQVVERKLSALQNGLEKSHERQSVSRERAALAPLAAKLLSDKQWAERTSCPSGYVTSGCKEYKGSLPPGVPN